MSTLNSDAAEVLTPRTRTTLRRASFWVIALLVVAGVAVGMYVLQRVGSEAERLDSESPAPVGARAVAEVLRQQGVEVTATDSLDATAAAVGDPDRTTILLYDRDLLLDDAQLHRVAGLATRLVVVTPGLLAVGELLPGASHAGGITGPLEADCDLPVARRAEQVSGAGSAYRVDGADLVGCFGEDGRYALVAGSAGGTEIVVLGLPDLLSNAEVSFDGNAALALGVLGERERLIWYIPGTDDAPPSGAPATLDELTPPWLTPLAILLILVFVAIAVWRGRRLGAPVVERLPVTVPASETVDGRARLYARSGSRGHALDALRVGAISRLASRLGLPRSATTAEVVDAVAAALRRDRTQVAAVLVDREPESDGDLVRAADELARLEAEVAAASRRL